jgi:hypothetical protein
MKTSLKIKKRMKKALEELTKDKGSSVELKFSIIGIRLFGLINGRVRLKDRGNKRVILFGEKFGTTDEIYVNKISTPPK